jgi:N-methylhydantoinase B
VVLLGDRSQHPALGINGGSPGDVASVIDDNGALLPLKSVTTLPAGGGLTISFAGGGGYGPPAAREPADIAADLRAGFITHEAAVRDYGVDSVTTAGRDSD